MPDLRTFSREFQQSVTPPPFDVVVDRRRRRTRNRLLGAAAATVVTVGVVLGVYSDSVARRATPAPATTPVPTAVADWLVVRTSFGLETVRSDGTSRKQAVSKLDHDPYDADWARSAGVLAWVRIEDDKTRDVWVSESDGSGAKKAFDCFAPCTAAYAPKLSPDGRQVVVHEAISANDRTWLIDVATGDRRAVDLGPGTTFVVTDWSADGKVLLGARYTTTSGDSVSSDIVTVRVDSVPTDGVAPATVLLSSGDRGVGRARWSPSGKWLLYLRGSDSSRAAVAHLYVARADGTGSRLVLAPSDPTTIDSPVWSGDERHVYVTRGIVTHYGTLSRVDLASGALTDLHDHLGNTMDAYELDGG